jgi:hypothetical protein
MLKIAPKHLMQTALVWAEFLPTTDAVCFPSPVCPYNTSVATAELIDYRRLDPYAPIPQPRALMISLFHPVSPAACSLDLTPYMDPITAAFEDAEYAPDGVQPGAVESLYLQMCHPHPKSNLHSGRRDQVSTYPLVLFSPGMGNTRLFYSAMAQQ